MHVCLGVRDALLEGAVGVRPVLLQRVVLRRQQVVHRGPQPLGPGPGAWRKIFVDASKNICIATTSKIERWKLVIMTQNPQCNENYQDGSDSQSTDTECTLYLEMPARCSERNEPRFPEC